jgi:flagellar biosynthesis protein
MKPDMKQADREAAVAISYEQESGAAPKVVASGYGEVAKRILEIARESDIHIRRDDNLVQLLARVPVGAEIPEQAYQLVAELLAFLYQTDRRLAKRRQQPSSAQQ